jgi:tRNA-specific 2-thiouridylase
MRSVIVALSGGVDSSVAALLLKQQEYKVIGITFKNFNYDKYSAESYAGNCCSPEALNNAGKLCDLLQIPHYVLNRVDMFERVVVDNFKSEYLKGMTPNPCVRCNSLVRWPQLIRLADDLGVDFVATGHYAGIVKKNGDYLIKRAKYQAKDQTYALWGINPEYLKRTIFPVGDYAKDQIRRVAGENGLGNAFSRESQDICFVPEGDYASLLGELPPGEIVDTAGQVMGRHKGLGHYTIGQRHGLGIANPEPLYVLKIEPESNRLVIGTKEQLLKSSFEAASTNWFIDISPGDEIKCEAKIRYRHQPAACAVTVEDKNRALVVFDHPQKAITPGQSAVFYVDDTLIGGGVIERIIN